MDAKIQIYQIALVTTAAELIAHSQILSKDEILRAKHYKFESDRQRFITARANLRLILAQHLDTLPQNLQFSYGAHGKPSLVNAPHLNFNLSHSGQLAVCAVSYHGAIGVDIEYLKPRHHLNQIANRFFYPEELATFQQFGCNLTTFLRIWTAKESHLKATGVGLSKLSTVATQWAEGKIVGLQVNHRPVDGIIWELDLPPSYLGTLVNLPNHHV